MREATRWARAIRMLDPRGQAGQLRRERLERLGPGRHRRPGPAGRLPLASTSTPAATTTGPTCCSRTRPSAPSGVPGRSSSGRPTGSGSPEPPRIAYDEWNVWYRDRRPARWRSGTHFADALAVGDLPEHLRPELRLGADGQPGADGERDRADRHHRRTPWPSSRSTTRCCCTPRPRWTRRWTCTWTARRSARERPAATSRWPHRVADLGPFRLVDAAASVSADRGRIAVTLVNRSPDEAETVEVVLRDIAFGGSPRSGRSPRTRPAARTLPDVETSGPGPRDRRTTKDGTVTLTLPPQSFTVIEAAMTSR